MGGVSARLAEGEVFSWANKLTLNSKVPTTVAQIRCLVFMHTFYQKYLDIGTRRFGSKLKLEFLRDLRESFSAHFAGKGFAAAGSPE